MRIGGRRVVGGYAEGEALVSPEPVSFYGGIDPETGIVTEPGHCLCGQIISGKVFAFPTGKGSTVGSYVIYRMKKLGTAPAAIINAETEAIIVTGCVLAGVPLIDRLEAGQFKLLRTGSHVEVHGDEGYIEVSS